MNSSLGHLKTGEEFCGASTRGDGNLVGCLIRAGWMGQAAAATRGGGASAFAFGVCGRCVKATVVTCVTGVTPHPNCPPRRISLLGASARFTVALSMSRNPSQPPSDSGSPQVQLSRPFRSRKNRPCDGCRRAKSRCAIPQSGPPCVECQQMNKQCTFDELPPERKKPKAPSSPIASTSSHLATEPQNLSLSLGKVKRPRSPDEGSAALQALSYAAAQEKRLRIGESEHMSLDLSIGGSLDPHVLTTLLTDDLLPIGTKQAGPDDSPLTETAHIRQISCDRSKPQYIIFTKKRNELNVNPPGTKQLAILKDCLSLLDPPPSAGSLGRNLPWGLQSCISSRLPASG
ncbi:hypothetical protein DFH06DRAFT_488965 [Mycena polygramma]|nr:hypothetical protein DFH06DRAFT_488965 [Mycena polygramma]